MKVLDAVLASAPAGRELKVPVDQLGDPTTFGPDVAAAALELLQHGAGGIWNVAGPEPEMDRLVFAGTICRAAGLDDGFHRPVSTAELAQSAPRPLNGGLSIAKLSAAGIAMRPLARALDDWRRGLWPWPCR